MYIKKIYDRNFPLTQWNKLIVETWIFQFLQEGARIQAQLTLSLTTLAKTKEKYEKAFGASEKALEAYNKADADLNLSRADVEKHRMNSNIKRQQMDDSKNEYANQLQKTNELQVGKYWGFLWPVTKPVSEVVSLGPACPHTLRMAV